MKISGSLALLAAGIVLLILGFIEYDSTNSDISRFFSGSPTDKSTWLLVGGAAASVAGLAGLWRKGRAV